MSEPIYRATTRILAERAELIRLCAARVIADHEAGRRNDPAALEWARGEAKKHQPLHGALSDGVARPSAFTAPEDQTHAST